MSTPMDDPILLRLRQLAKQAPALGEMASVYGNLLPILRDANLDAAPLTFTREQVSTKLSRGQPLLQGCDLELNIESARILMIRLARALEHSDSGSRPNGTSAKRVNAASRIRRTLERNTMQVGTLLARAAARDVGFIHSVAESLQLDGALLWTITQNTLKPALRLWAQQCAPLVQGIEWHKGYCFICGAGATLAALQGNDQIKHLRCSDCGADWTMHRIQCMYCGNENHKTYSYFYPEGAHEKQRVEVCDECGGYLKVISSFEPLAVELLTVQDLATLYLDYIAQARGYARVPMR
jgi:hypothetical protein